MTKLQKSMTKTTTKREAWFDSHVIVMGPNSDIEDKIRNALKAKVCSESQEAERSND
jgi:hypothetical protein